MAEGNSNKIIVKTYGIFCSMLQRVKAHTPSSSGESETHAVYNR